MQRRVPTPCRGQRQKQKEVVMLAEGELLLCRKFSFFLMNINSFLSTFDNIIILIF